VCFIRRKRAMHRRSLLKRAAIADAENGSGICDFVESLAENAEMSVSFEKIDLHFSALKLARARQPREEIALKFTRTTDDGIASATSKRRSRTSHVR
jgi:hypothetical protein